MKLNLTICQNTRIDISIPVDINYNEIDKHNPNSKYYNDICTKAISNSNTDLSLSERKNQFINKNMSLCEEDCNLIQYNSSSKRAKCSCLVKFYLPKIKDIKFDKKKLLKSFIDIKNIANINFMKCYKEVFTKKNLIKNYGFFIYTFIFVLYILCLLIFWIKYYSKIKKEIHKLMKSKLKFLLENNPKNGLKHSIKVKTKKRKTNKKKKLILKEEIEKDSKNVLNIARKNTENIHRKNKNDLQNKKLLKFNGQELNSLSYKEALIYDKRTYIQYYISLLKSNHLLIFSFYICNKDYNSPIIKMFLFFFYFATNLAINALFFNDDTMHKIHIDKGKFDIIYQIPIILYSTFISETISNIIKYLALSENIIFKIKREKSIIFLKNKKIEIYRKIKIKFILFFIMSFFLLLLFMYYISCFCGVYINTQIHLIKDTIISFAISLIYPFGIYLIPGIFRLSSLRAKDKNQECLYKFSYLFENLPI